MTGEKGNSGDKRLSFQCPGQTRPEEAFRDGSCEIFFFKKGALSQELEVDVNFSFKEAYPTIEKPKNKSKHLQLVQRKLNKK